MILDSLHLMGVFARVAETRSFTRAAARLGITPSAASKAIARLEDKLGVRLIVRTTRHVRLTEEGELLLETCRRVLAEMESTEAQLSRRVGEVSGRLRLHSTLGFGRCVVVPLLTEFARKWPTLAIDMDLSERDVDLQQEPFDVSIRFGQLPDSTLVARPLGCMRFVTVASPAYLQRRGTPAEPDDLARHDCLGYFQPRTLRYRDWEYSGAHTQHTPSAHLNFNNAQALLEAAIDGVGIVYVPRIMAWDALHDGRLQPLLEPWATEGWPVSLVYAERRYQSTRVRTLVDFLLERIPADLRWRGDSGEVAEAGAKGGRAGLQSP
ncbi:MULTISPECIES: LysR family transcriptional regulator [Ramlibacter]|nr:MULTISPECIES: LysR family transcriptional regulator [Ramlibacter]MBA2961929.1 LysR family transcriptional regulator [Ramlibacter sp. CGMCC 1.13660]